MTRLRVRSARVRAPAQPSGSAVDEDEDTPAAVTPVRPIRLFSQVTREEAEGEEEEEDEEQEACEGGETFRREAAGAEDGGRGKRSEESEEEEGGKEEEEERKGEELENDPSFQRVDHQQDTF